MKFIKGVPNILVNNAFEIKTVQYFDEDEDRVILRIAEYVPQFIKGYVCDMVFSFPLVDKTTYEVDEQYCSNANDLVLVTIRKSASIDDLPQFEYIFYKS